MIAMIEIYKDSGDLVNKYEVPPYEKRIDYDNDYEIHKYEFRFVYTEYAPKWQKGANK